MAVVLVIVYSRHKVRGIDLEKTRYSFFVHHNMASSPHSCCSSALKMSVVSVVATSLHFRVFITDEAGFDCELG